MIITIDGPSGVGKGTVARLLAKHYKFSYLDTGLLFRQVAFLLLTQKGDLNKEEDVLKALSALDLQSESASSKLRTDEVSQAASKISTYLALRKELLIRQREFATSKENKVVFDGRDMGTVVFPDAEKKIFLEASAEVRAKRRVDDLEGKGLQAEFQEILQSIQERDLRDATRAIAPTKPASDALIIDTSDLSIEDVFQRCVSFVEK
ncbi:(d)CMP kinase [Alphaproteobacteria bacterium]|nr:(d)CMP kinase [Alphaproteobacteria bacterium]